MPELQPGTYKIRAEAKGFRTVERPNIVIEVAQDLRVDMSLPTGSVNETVVVTDEIPLVDSVSSTLGGTLSNAGTLLATSNAPTVAPTATQGGSASATGPRR